LGGGESARDLARGYNPTTGRPLSLTLGSVTPASPAFRAAGGAVNELHPERVGEIIVIGSERTRKDVVLRHVPDDLVERMTRGSSGPSFLSSRPVYSGEDRLFSDLLQYAPGLNTSAADLRAVLEAEALPGPESRPGKIDPTARALFAKARPTGWRA